jgi:hypothetical protein
MNVSQQLRRHHYAASVAVRILIIFLPVDLDIDYLERVNLPLFLKIRGWWRRKPTESLKNILVNQDAIPVPRRLVLLHPLLLNPGQEFLSHGFWRSTVQGTVLDENALVVFPDFAGLTDLPVELLSTIASHVSNSDLFNLRLTSRILCAGLADDFDRRFFQDRTHLYTIRSLKSLVQISRVPRVPNAIKRLTVVVSQFIYRDPDAIQKHIEGRIPAEVLRSPYTQQEQGRIYRSGRTSGLLPPHQTMSIPPPPYP